MPRALGVSEHQTLVSFGQPWLALVSHGQPLVSHGQPWSAFVVHGRHLVSVVAYNAGGRRVRIWLSSWSPRNPETWVSGLPFEETRAYVRRVFFSYLVTRRLLHEPDLSLNSLMLRG